MGSGWIFIWHRIFYCFLLHKCKKFWFRVQPGFQLGKRGSTRCGIHPQAACFSDARKHCRHDHRRHRHTAQSRGIVWFTLTLQTSAAFVAKTYKNRSVEQLATKRRPGYGSSQSISREHSPPSSVMNVISCPSDRRDWSIYNTGCGSKQARPT